MYFKLGAYRILERDIKYVRWTPQNDGDWIATICFRDGEEITVHFIPEIEKNTLEEYWNKDIERCMSYLYNTKEEEK